MQDALMDNNRAEEDYQAGFASVMRFHEYAKLRGWKLSDRQLIHEIIQRERAALISQKSSLPIVGQNVRSAAWNLGQANALRALLRAQHIQEDI